MSYQADQISRVLLLRLEEWGREYRLDRDYEPSERNLLYDLIRFRGRIPRGHGAVLRERTKGDEVEDLVRLFAKQNDLGALCLRICYCGRGPIRHKAELADVSVATFKTRVSQGEAFVAGALAARAA